jgi:hypothetical protein
MTKNSLLMAHWYQDPGFTLRVPAANQVEIKERTEPDDKRFVREISPDLWLRQYPVGR